MTSTEQKPAKPRDHLAKASKHATAQRREALDEPVDFDFDGDSFVIVPSAATQLEFLAALEDEEMVRACRLLLGHDQAARLFKGRSVEQLARFFEVMGEAIEATNP